METLKVTYERFSSESFAAITERMTDGSVPL
jgi:hypothetical protein